MTGTLAEAMVARPRCHNACAEFRVLGPLEVRVGDRLVPLGGGRQRALLAMLLLEANRVVPVDRLVDAIWGQTLPATVTAQLQAQVSGLRRVLSDGGAGDDLIVTRPPGYAIRVRPGQLDVELFEQRAAQAREATAQGHLAEAAAGFAAALDLWRGPALAGGTGPFVEAAAARFAERRSMVLEQRIDADLELGRHTDLIPELTALVDEHPLRERLRAMFMTALYRAGRQADALAIYRQTRELLVEELGVDPSPELQRLEQAILQADLALEPDVRLVTSSPLSVVSPAQLPADIADFTGRAKQAAQIRDVLAAHPSGDNEGRAVQITAVAGRAGVGKTALAVHVAHQLRGAYPDGQLYVNLHGAGPEPVDPAEVLGDFLRALGVDSSQIPDGVDQRSGMYRSRLAGRRLLVVLDNAASEAQIRPLLPGTAECAVVVTSRIRLDALAGVKIVELDILDRDSAVELLSRIAGPERVAADPQAAQEVVRLCGHLPLAVRIAAARLAARPHWPLDRMAVLLTDEQRRLDQLRLGELEVRASLSLSYHGLGQDARRAFRRLGLLDTADFASWTAAAVLDTSGYHAEQVLDTLARAQLLEVTAHHVTGQDRYRFHDLVWLYARERAHAEESATDRAQALTRLLSAGLTITQQINRALFGVASWTEHHDIPRWHLDPELSREALANPTGWYEAERHGPLPDAVRRGAAMDLGELVWQLADALVFFFVQNGEHVHLTGQVDHCRGSHDLALRAARRGGHRRGEAVLLLGLAVLHAFQHHVADAMDCLEQAQVAFAELGDRQGEAFVTYSFGLAHALAAQGEQALPYFDEALAIFRDSADLFGQAITEDSIGRTYLRQDRLDQADGHLRAAVQLFQRLGHHTGEATALDSLGTLYRRQQRFDEAIRCFQRCTVIADQLDEKIVRARALLGLADVDVERGCHHQAQATFEQCREISRPLGYRHGEALALDGLGRVHLAAGRTDPAIRSFERALEILHDVPIPSARATMLRRLGATPLATSHRDAARVLAARLARLAPAPRYCRDQRGRRPSCA